MNMVLLLCESFCWGVSLISLLNVLVAGGETVIGPENLIHKLQPALPEIESYAKLQIRLEDIADESHLYEADESHMFGMLINLHQNKEVRDIVSKCEKLHQPLMCNYSLYRSHDGSCNNLKHPEWGKAITEQRRLLPANYDGTKGARKSISGQELPLPRYISLKSGSESNPSNTVSALFTFFGQFITHDVVLTPITTENGTGPKCCGSPGANFSSCFFAINYPKEDPFFSRINVTCQNFIRAAPFPKCNFDKRGIINKKTSFIDASNVYDNNNNASSRLRTNDGTGKLRTRDTIFGTLMPENKDVNTKFCPFETRSECFEGGDDRLNQHTMLTSLQTIFVRAHNEIANNLFKLNPQWEEEKIYQEARRIAIAIHQLIIYREYLPHLIGPEYMDRYDLNINLNEKSLYNDEVDPSVTAEFAIAAFRVHSMTSTRVSSFMPLLKFHDTYSNLKPLHRGELDPLLAGSCEVPSEQNDSFQADDVSHFTYKPPGAMYGSDLTSTDLQRGRDAGLPTYVDTVKMCSKGAMELIDFSDLKRSNLMTEKNVLELEDIYEDVRDVDLISGIYREMHVENGEVGPTAACVIAIQFHRLKYGDSFFATHINGRYPFTKDQMEEIQNWSLARLLCETTRLNEIRMKPFTLPNERNPLVPCRSFPPMNFVAWKE